MGHGGELPRHRECSGRQLYPDLFLDKVDPGPHSTVVTCEQCCGAGAGTGTFWSELVCWPGSGSILDKTEEILNDILFVHSHVD